MTDRELIRQVATRAAWLALDGECSRKTQERLAVELAEQAMEEARIPSEESDACIVCNGKGKILKGQTPALCPKCNGGSWASGA